jgi:hypothetical protein
MPVLRDHIEKHPEVDKGFGVVTDVMDIEAAAIDLVELINQAAGAEIVKLKEGRRPPAIEVDVTNEAGEKQGVVFAGLNFVRYESD